MYLRCSLRRPRRTSSTWPASALPLRTSVIFRRVKNISSVQPSQCRPPIHIGRSCKRTFATTTSLLSGGKLFSASARVSGAPSAKYATGVLFSVAAECGGLPMIALIIAAIRARLRLSDFIYPAQPRGCSDNLAQFLEVEQMMSALGHKQPSTGRARHVGYGPEAAVAGHEIS